MLPITDVLITFVTILGGGYVLDSISSLASRERLSKYLFDRQSDFGLPERVALGFDYFFFGSPLRFLAKTASFSFFSLCLIAAVTLLRAPPTPAFLDDYGALLYKWPVFIFLMINLPADLINIVKSRWLLYFAVERNSFLVALGAIFFGALTNMMLWVFIWWAWLTSPWSVDVYQGSYWSLLSEAFSMSILDRKPLMSGNTFAFTTYLSVFFLSSLLLEIFALAFSLAVAVTGFFRFVSSHDSFEQLYRYPFTYLSIPLALAAIMFEMIL